jgi:hypothetical protein
VHDVRMVGRVGKEALRVRRDDFGCGSAGCFGAVEREEAVLGAHYPRDADAFPFHHSMKPLQ